MHDVVGQRAVLAWVLVVTGLFEVPLVEGIVVQDERSTGAKPLELALQRRRVHRHQHVRRVAWGVDVVVGDVHLERGHAGEGALGRPDLCGELRQCCQIVPGECAGRGEAVTRQLHAVS